MPPASPSSNLPLRGQVSEADIRLLRIFKTVVDCGGFSAAEVELNISRAAISIAIADLEKRLGLRLCQRGRGGFALTDEGAEVHTAALQVLSALESFKTHVNALHAQLKGELNIGITDNLVTMPHMRITHALAALKQRGAEVRINIHMLPPNEIEIAVLDGRLQIGIIPELRPLPSLNYLPLYTEEALLYCSQQHPLFDGDDQQLNDKTLAKVDAVLPAYAQTADIKALQQCLKASATATDREGIAFLILTGCFIGYLPTHYAELWVNQGAMRPLAPERYRYQTGYFAVTRKGDRPHLVLETYLQELERTG
ncbi:LysR family transcriptional regulator [Balneatrix alpica]|uniref:LysR family transcriptional regulator n=1 Tax=Balneatrix alpica TaxID=75684 RepID=A0ABV5ZDQ3_9GAMM|nr:LysR family transcriptional regulator [Balneatrix alpica]